jgi:integrase
VATNAPKRAETCRNRRIFGEDMGKPVKTVEGINDRLKAAGVPLRIRQKGNALYLRGKFPVKPGDVGKEKRYDVALRLPASQAGLKQAETNAHGVDKAIREGSFNWAEHIDPRHDPQAKPIGQWIEEFRSHYLSSRSIKEKTWTNTWHSTLKKLPQDEPLRDSLLLAVALATEQDSRNRELTCQRLQRLADFAEVPIDLRPYIGDYEPEPRDIPTDDLIIEWRDRIPNLAWQWVFGLIATFGIRPHEAFACQLVDQHTLKIGNDTKTGGRIARAIRPEWSKRWDLMDVKLPNTLKQGREPGQLVSRQFSRYGVPFVPYDLRHAWAIRASVTHGLPVSTAAKMMGHSVTTHTRVYHRWLSEAESERVYKALILGEATSALT